MKKSTPNQLSGSISEADLPGKPGRDDFLIVGLGASAGGIQALKRFFEHVPADSGMAYVVILHLSPEHESRLAEVLQTVAKIPVAQVTEKVRVAPNHVYVVPPSQHLEMLDGHIIVTLNTTIEERRAPVDIFFRTLAESHEGNAVAVVLSGTGANGSMGIKRIKEKGGAAFVQNPDEAEFNEMPRNSIATDLIDEVLNVAEIPAKIVAYRDSLGTIEIAAEPEARPEDQQQALREIFTQLRQRTGHDFSNYKRPTLLRRIERRVNIRGLPSLLAYAAYLHEQPEETQGLLKDLLISVTNFFRDVKPFEAIEQDLLPRIIQGKEAEEPLRVWIVGCATGEEAYSLAMLCAERTLGVLDAPKVQIFATDIDEQAIAKARDGLYTLNDAADVSPERLRRFFSKEGDGYRIRRELRELILFAQHNVLKDPPFSHIDLATCRNMMIYLNPTAQERVMEALHFALKPGGYLVLGTSESVDGASDLYATVNREHRIYQSRDVATRSYPVPESIPTFRIKQAGGRDASAADSGKRERTSYGELHARLLEQYAPPSVVVNEEYDITHVSERAGVYLQIAGGEPSKNLLQLVLPELRLELRAALYQAAQRRTNVELKNLTVRIGERTETLNVHVRPVLHEADTARGFMLVIFEPSPNAAKGDLEKIFTSDQPVARQLEEELIRLKGRLRASSDQYELQAEELKASNEELQALNEELRSAAEELETSKEELQSINEELTTVNQELKVKIEEVSLTGNNLRNLINSTDIGTIFLDRGFRVQLFTPSSRKIFNLISADIGRPLSDITNRLVDDGILADAETVLDKLSVIERQVRTTEGRVYLMRILPYRTADDRIQGTVATFFDITERKRAEEALRVNEDRISGQKEAFQAAINGAALADSLNILARVVTGETGAEARTAFYITDAKGVSLHTIRGAGDMPDSYADRIDGFLIGEDSLACGLAIPTGQPVLTRDVSAEPLWQPWIAMAHEFDFRGCWSFPIKTRDNKGIGTFAMYFRLPREPSSSDLALADIITRSAAIIISSYTEAQERAAVEENLRQSEERFQAMANNISQLAWICDKLGNVTWYNQRWLDYTGMTFDAMRGWDWSKVQHPDHLERVVVGVRRSADTGELWEDTFPLLGKDGRYRWFLSQAVPIRNASGDVVRWFGTNTDITAERRAEEALREADRRKDEFLAILAHELRNPLAAIKNAGEILLRTDGDRRSARSAAEILNRQVVHMIRQVDDLLDVNRISRGKIELRMESIELSAVVDQAVEAVRPLCDQLQHELTVTLPPSPIYVHGDPVRLVQVVANLLNNAFKFTNNRGRISLIVERMEAHRDEAVIRVRDSGIGIAAAELLRVFEMFAQVDRSLDRSHDGLGLGLTLVKNLVEKHGGTVEASSEGLGRGSEFVVRLPTLAGVPKKPSRPTVSGPTPTTARRILVVDDNRDSATSLARLLKLTGHTTHSAYDGLEGVEAAARFRPDVVLLDIGLPTLNGYEAARKIREQPWGKDMILVALTGWGQDEYRQKSSEAGFNAHMVKPVDLDALTKLLAELDARET